MKKYLFYLMMSAALIVPGIATANALKSETEKAIETQQSYQHIYQYTNTSTGIVYKLCLQEERGTWTIQVYSSDANKWTFGTILEAKPEKGYWKFVDGLKKTWYIQTYGSGNLTLYDGANVSLTYIKIQ